MPINISSNAAGVIVNIIFGVVALVIGIITIIQAYKAYKMWHAAGHDEENHASSEPGNPCSNLAMMLTFNPDIELERQTPPSASS
jgi:hypothetical protein